jgi:acyl-CoA reductase-like NAD-dependent aldehyde dehydrogenase
MVLLRDIGSDAEAPLPAVIRGAGEPDVVDDTAPATGDLLARVEQAGPDHVAVAVTLARAAQPEWRRTGARERAQQLVAFADELQAAAEALALIECRDTGHPLRAMRADVAKGIGTLRMYAGAALEMKGTTIPASPEGLHIRRPEPWGVVGAITAYNHPFLFACLRTGPALLAGNALILKPAPQAPLSVIAFGELAQRALPPGVLTVLPGGTEAGAALAGHPEVPRLTFTGSVASGLAVQACAASSGAFKSLTLELGGKNPLLVFDDVDPAEAATAIVKGMNFTRVQGQSCGSTSRALIHETVHDAVVAELVERVEALHMGLPEDDATDVGALISHAHRDRILAVISAAGQPPIVGGGPPTARPDLARGAYLAPTVFDHVDPEAALASTEIFGPVLSVMTFRTEAEAIALANATEYGLTASIWTHDLDRALRVADAVEAGYVWINDVETRYPGVPFGGWKQSGIGTEQGLADEILAFTRGKSLNIRLRPAP